MDDYQGKIYRHQGGDRITIKDGGTINLQSGAKVGRVCGASFNILEEVDDVITVSCQLTDADGVTVSESYALPVFISDSISGLGLCDTTPSGGIEAVNGYIVGTLASGKSWLWQSEVNGTIELDITEVGSKTLYLVVMLPCGMKVVSDAITFTV